MFQIFHFPNQEHENTKMCGLSTTLHALREHIDYILS
jgi:hypothetical protein